jgi:hypothetical protein
LNRKNLLIIFTSMRMHRAKAEHRSRDCAPPRRLMLLQFM